ncbi:hypothetical protein O181_014307 [Austropuccinia psidii MF-1]|uniref:Retrotransposon gag domain-containing protein n=1 Tax=Austropuccinia psidii MF-1 TaxID=1389203 RepID=A0A9Q3BZY5_9BASI|nr:hypothetical protein [Austropuccinia psidii MF-1]
MRQRTPFGSSTTIQEGRKRAKKIKFILRSSWPIGRTFKTTFKGPGEDGEEEEENSVEEEDCDGTERVPSPVGASQESFSQDRKKVLYSISFLIERDPKWIKPYCSNLTNQDPSYLLNSWQSFEFQLFTLFGDPNAFRKGEEELDALRMREGGHVSLYIADFRGFVSRIGDLGERALSHHFRKRLLSRILDLLASHPSRIDSIQDLMDITLELDTRYHERQKEKSHHQEKNPEASKSNSSHPQNSSSSSQKKMNFQKRDKPHSSSLNNNFKLIDSEKERRIKEGLCTYCAAKHSIDSSFTRPQNKLT